MRNSVESVGDVSDSTVTSSGVARLNIRRRLGTTILFVASLAFSLILAEGILRLVLDPVDYLMPYIVTDNILRGKILPNSGGHDVWGYRNRAVPSQADIVAIGDSMTYGNAASAANSWPATLQRLTGKTVYNLALGGHGPVEHKYLLESKAVLLKPSAVVVGFYFGNDLTDAFYLTYRKDYWKDLRSPDFAPEPDEPSDNFNPDTGIFLGSLRSYLAHNSILYRTAMLSFGETLRFLEMKYAGTNDTTIFEDAALGIRTGFTPLTTLQALNLDDPKVKEGLRITMEVLLQMKQFCEDRGIRFYVLMLPTKESVFASYIDHRDMNLTNGDAIHQVIANEHTVNELLKAYFEEKNISNVDVLEPLIKAAGTESIYPTNADTHPNKNGYEIIARELMAQLKL